MTGKEKITKGSLEQGDFSRLPVPQPGRAGSRKAVFWAVLALFCVLAATFWLLTAPEDRLRFRNQTADMVEEWTKDTPVAWLSDILRKKKPELPASVTAPPTERGTLAGRKVNGVIASPVEVGDRQMDGKGLTARELIERVTSPTAPETGQVFSGTPLPPVTEDREIRPDYLASMANWLAARYRPGPAGGSLAMTIQNLNSLWGTTIAAGATGGRRGLLRYAFHPGMITGLYNLYIDRFMTDLDEAAKKRGLNETENRAFHRAIAGRATLAANSLTGVLAVNDLGGRLKSIDDLAQEVVDVNARMAEAVTELDNMRKNKGSQTQLATIRMRVDGLAARYRRAVDEHARAQQALAAEIRQHGGVVLDEESLLFMAAWVERREGEEGTSRQTFLACVDVLRDLARRCNMPAPDVAEGAQ